MRMWPWISGILLITGATLAQTTRAQDLPLFGISGDDIPFGNQKQFDASQTNVTQFQVLIFPHFGQYATPQGREADASRVTIRSTLGCVETKAIQDQNGEWQSVPDQKSPKKSFEWTFRSHTMPSPLYFKCDDSFFVMRGGALRTYQYRGNFVVRPESGRVQVISLISSEDYLRGVVPSEVLPSWPTEVLRAQAVAARTYAWWSVLNARRSSRPPRKPRAFDMDDTVQYQVYTGISDARASTDAAVSDTKNRMMVSKEKTIIKAFFSADSGGHTESAKEGFSQELSYCQAKPEVYDLSLDRSQFSKEISLGEMTRILRNAKEVSDQATVVSIHVSAVNDTGRVRFLNLRLDDGNTVILSGARVAFLFKIRSRRFQLSEMNGNPVFVGNGFGHGVGMAQVGAQRYAALGWNFEQILKFYYTDVTLTE